MKKEKKKGLIAWLMNTRDTARIHTPAVLHTISGV